MVVPERRKSQGHESMTCLRGTNQLSMATHEWFSEDD